MDYLQFFDPNQNLNIVDRQLPHWQQAGTVSFITFRTADSLPKKIIEKWLNERLAWLHQYGIDQNSIDWKRDFLKLSINKQAEFHRTFSSKWHNNLDLARGACVLRNQALAKLVADSLKSRNGQDYFLTDFIIMPNHVHLMAGFRSEEGMLKQCESWKKWTATRINQSIGKKGRFWKQDGFGNRMVLETGWF